jgi:hypothetical protein
MEGHFKKVEFAAIRQPPSGLSERSFRRRNTAPDST